MPPLTDGGLRNYSGGNQQKTLFAKWTLELPNFIVLDEPTRGVDIGAKRSIYEAIVNVAESGAAVLLISSELEEVLGMSHRTAADVQRSNDRRGRPRRARRRPGARPHLRSRATRSRADE